MTSTATHSGPSVINDIYDGQLYQELSTTGPRITFLLNTDGVVLFKSTTHTMWPVFLMVNELPFSMRYYYIITLTREGSGDLDCCSSGSSASHTRVVRRSLKLEWASCNHIHEPLVL